VQAPPVGVCVPRPTLRPARDRLSRGLPPPRSASLLVAERYLLAVGQPPAHRLSPAATNEGVDFEVFFTAEMLTFARCYPRARSLPSSGSLPWVRSSDPTPVAQGSTRDVAVRSSQSDGRMRSPSAFLRPEEQLAVAGAPTHSRFGAFPRLRGGEAPRDNRRCGKPLYDLTVLPSPLGVNG
jgi:hypothetical protein